MAWRDEPVGSAIVVTACTILSRTVLGGAMTRREAVTSR
jgi:hypothetical protein